MLLTKEKGFYKNFFSLWYVLVLNNVIVLGVNLADNIMLGNFSEAALSGATACNQLQFIFQQLITGIGSTVVMLGSQHWGQKSTAPIKKIAGGAVLFGTMIATVMFLLAAFIPKQLVMIFTDSEPIIAEGVEYLRIIKYTYPVFALTNILLATMRSVESVRIGFYVSLSTLLVNISLNYVLIFGKLGFPVMGTRGAALATLIARVVELLVVIIYISGVDNKLTWKLRDLREFDSSLFKLFIITCLPVMITDGLFGISTALQTAILGHLDDAAISANSVASTLYQLLKVASVGSAGAASVIIGKTVGEGRVEKTKEYAKTMQLLFIGIGILTGIALFFLRIPIISAYKISEEAKSLANGFLLVLCIVSVGMAYQMPTNTGIVRGGGDSKHVLRMDIISIWCIVLPISALAAFVLHWHPIAVIACLNADQVFKCIPAVVKCNRFNWMKKLT
ncbi:MAG: MATE family efflux transporter [Clostridia bacterium]|nr:MATE family efflux transporter [Clostridia bacterium]